MIRLSSILTFTAAALLGLAVTVSMAEAKKGSGHRGAHHHAGHHHHAKHHAKHRHAGKHRHYAHRHGYWRNGVWVGAGAAAAYGYTGSCSYAYTRWQQTGSKYWRTRYYNCIN